MAAFTSIDNPELYFQAALFAGNGTAASSTQSITFDGSEDMQPDLVWFKKRSGADDHELFDSARGVQKALDSNNENAEASGRGLTAFNSDGFTVGNGSSAGNQGATNENGHTFVTWNWKESATAGFDIVLYTGTGSTNNVSHALSAVPHVMIVKRRNTSEGWQVYHHKQTSDPEDYVLTLDTTAAPSDSNVRWNDTAPTSSVFTVESHGTVNGSSDTYVNYLWTEKQGFSKFGSYTGNGNADGTFIFCGFRPAWIMLKRSSASGDDWVILDNKRAGYNVANYRLFANDSRDEETPAYIDFLSNGFKLRSSGNDNNGSGSTYIYMTFAEAPFVNSNGVPCNAR